MRNYYVTHDKVYLYGMNILFVCDICKFSDVRYFAKKMYDYISAVKHLKFDWTVTNNISGIHYTENKL